MLLSPEIDSLSKRGILLSHNDFDNLKIHSVYGSDFSFIPQEESSPLAEEAPWKQPGTIS